MKTRVRDREIREAILHHWREAVPNDRIGHLVRDAGRACARALQMRLAEHAVPYGHWTFLTILWEADGLTQTELAVQAGVMTSTTVTALRAMEKLGYITRARSPSNRKNVYVHLTSRGKALKRKLTPLRDEVNRVAVRGVRPSDVIVTRRTLHAIIENLTQDELATTNSKRRVVSTQELSRLISNGGSA